jgi:hypothetical protein
MHDAENSAGPARFPAVRLNAGVMAIMGKCQVQPSGR